MRRTQGIARGALALAAAAAWLALHVSAAAAVPLVISEIEPNATAATAGNLRLDPASACFAAGSGEVNSSTDFDAWSFGSAVGTDAWALLDTGGPQNGGATSRDSELWLVRSDFGTTIEADDDDGTGLGLDGVQETDQSSVIGGAGLLDGGSSYLVVREFGQDGVIDPYLIFVARSTAAPLPEQEPNNTVATATPAPNCTRASSGAISVGSDTDHYSFQLVAGQTVLVIADADPERDDTAPNLTLELLGPADAPATLAPINSDEGLPSVAEGFAIEAVSTGTYKLKVEAFGGASTGTYELLIAPEGAPVSPPPSPVDPPAVPAAPPTATTTPTQGAAKKCKKGRKRRHGKCVKGRGKKRPRGGSERRYLARNP